MKHKRSVWGITIWSRIRLLIWDFDKTLIPGYMQEPIFKKYNVDAGKFWNEVNSLPYKYAELGTKVNVDTIYLNHMITCANQGIFQGLDNETLYKLGKEIEFYSGVPQIFQDLKDVIQSNKKYAEIGIIDTTSQKWPVVFLSPKSQQIRRKTVGLACNHAEIPRKKS